MPAPAPVNDPYSAYKQRVIVKIKESVVVPRVGALEDTDLLPWDALRLRFRSITATDLFPTWDQVCLQALVDRAIARDPTYTATNFLNYLALTPASEDSVEELVTALATFPNVQFSYPEAGPSPAPGRSAPPNPLAVGQVYLAPAPFGVDARYAWTLKGGRGSRIRFIDVEEGWDLTHEDLAPSDVELVSGLNMEHGQRHGTEVLGVVVGADNKKGIIGIAPEAHKPRVVSSWRERDRPSVSEAILDAVSRLEFGDILLLEAQTQTCRPVEVEPASWDIIRLGTAIGITVVEAAGNGFLNLDDHVDENGVHFLTRDGSSAFRDSGAIVVAAATPTPISGAPWTPARFSNTGSRIDVFAQGEGVLTTCTDPWNGAVKYAASFNGTSSASAIIAGAALVVQGVVRAAEGSPLNPRALRTLLSAAATGTPSANPADAIGVMPNLRAILRQYE